MRTIRVLVADDSATMRTALTALLSEDPSIEVVGMAPDGVEAVEQAKRLRPDVITMDVQMPRLSGLDAIEAIMAEAPARILVVCAVGEGRQVDLSFRAISAGALELIAKPVGAQAKELRTWGRHVAESVKLMAEIPVITRRRRVQPEPLTSITPSGFGVEAVGLAASTGGPPALASILGALPRDFPAPLLIAQHIAAGFAKGLVRWFSEVSPLQLVFAETGMRCEIGKVYLPPDDHHLEVDPGGVLRISQTRGGHCPSADRLFESMAQAYGPNAIGVILTGMGDDGAAGLLAMRRAGATTLGQDEASSVVYGMPASAARIGAVKTQLSIEAIAPTLLELVEAQWLLHRAVRRS